MGIPDGDRSAAENFFQSTASLAKNEIFQPEKCGTKFPVVPLLWDKRESATFGHVDPHGHGLQDAILTRSAGPNYQTVTARK